MKACDSTLKARSVAETQRVAWLVELTSGDWTWRGATQAAALDGGETVYPARLGEVRRWREWLPTTGTEGGRARADALLRVGSASGIDGASASGEANADDGGLRAALQELDPASVSATLRLAWLDPTTMGSDAATAATMLRGRLTGWTQDATGLTLTLTDALEALGARRIGRMLRPGMLPGLDSTAIGGPLPWIFGSQQDAELVPLRVGATAKLAAALTADATVVSVASLAGFGASGTAQVGAELITYAAVDAAALTLGTTGAPVTRGASGTTAAAHAKGAVARCLPSAGLLWLVADHACLAVKSVMADLDAIALGAWTAETITLGGATAQGILMTTWPLNADGGLASRVSASVDGLADSSGTLIANPARAIEALLSNSRAGALDSGQIDSAALATAAASLATRGYVYARRLSGDETLGDLLDEAAEEAGLWILATDPIRLAVATPTPHDADATMTLDAARQLAVAATATGVEIAAPSGYLPPDGVELVGVAPTSDAAKPILAFPVERQADGACPKTYSMAWLDVSQTAAATDLGELLWRRQCDAPFTDEQIYAIGAALASAGDVARREWSMTGLPGSACWIREIQAGTTIKGRARAKIETWGPWALGYVWQQDASNYIRRYSGGSYASFVIAGAPVALLTREGTLRIAGELSEVESLGIASQSAPIAMVNGAIVLSCGAPGANGSLAGMSDSYAPFMKIDASGNASLAGSAREQSNPPFPAGGAEGQSYAAPPGSFWMAPGLREAALGWDATSRALYLPGIVIERASL